MKKIWNYTLVALWSIAIFLVSSWEIVPSPRDTLLNFVLKKTAHIGEYAVLYWLTFRAVNESAKRKKFLAPLVFAVFYAITDEIHQSFVPGRHARVYDVGFDALGGLLMIARIRSRDQRNTREKV